MDLTMCMEVPFPADHLPILAEIRSLSRAPVPLAMLAKGRYFVPRFPDGSQLDAFREHFGQVSPPAHNLSLDMDFQFFSNSILSSLEATFGPPADYVAIPRLVQNVSERYETIYTNDPIGLTPSKKTMRVAKMEAKIQAAWDIGDVQRQLRVSPICALCVTGSPAQAKEQYRLVTRAAETSRLESTYAAGETTPRE